MKKGRNDVVIEKTGKLIQLTFNRHSQKQIEKSNSYALAHFTDDEKNALEKLFERGKEAGFFTDYGIFHDHGEYSEFTFFDRAEDESAPSILSVLKGYTDSHRVAFIVKPGLGKGYPCVNFSDATSAVEQHLDIMMRERAIYKDRAERSARLGQNLQPLHIV